MQNQTPILTIKMVPAGIELVLAALNKLPREQSDGLFNEIAGQYGYQMQQLQKAAEASQGAAAPTPSPDAEKPAVAPADPVSATANTGE